MERSAGLSYIRQVRKTLDDGKHKIFITLLTGFGQGSISDSFLIDALTKLFSDHHLLLQGFQSYIPPPPPRSDVKLDPTTTTTTKEFTTRHKEEDISDHQPPRKKVKVSEDVLPAQIQRATDFCNKVRRRFNDNDGVYKSFLDALTTCYDRNNDHRAAALEVENELKLLFGSKKGKEFIDEEEKKLKKKVVERHPDLVLELAWFMADFKTEDEQDKEAWESMKYGNRKQSCFPAPKKKHPCAEMLNKLDDDQSDVDILFHSLESTCDNLCNFVEAVEETEGPVVLEDFLSAINLRCIERVYGLVEGEDGYGQTVIEELRVNPIEVSKLVFYRLHQKLKEMKDEREIAEKIWANARKDCHEKLEKVAQQSSRSLALNSSSLEPSMEKNSTTKSEKIEKPS